MFRNPFINLCTTEKTDAFCTNMVPEAGFHLKPRESRHCSAEKARTHGEVFTIRDSSQVLARSRTNLKATVSGKGMIRAEEVFCICVSICGTKFTENLLDCNNAYCTSLSHPVAETMPDHVLSLRKNTYSAQNLARSANIFFKCFQLGMSADEARLSVLLSSSIF